MVKLQRVRVPAGLTSRVRVYPQPQSRVGGLKKLATRAQE